MHWKENIGHEVEESTNTNLEGINVDPSSPLLPTRGFLLPIRVIPSVHIPCKPGMPPPPPPPMPGEDCVCSHSHSMASSWDPSSSHSSLTEYLLKRELGGARGASSSSRVPYGSAGVPYGLAYARARAVLPFVFGSSLGGTPVVIRLSGAPCGFVASKGASTPAPSMQAAAPTQTQTLGAGRNVNAGAAGPTLTIQQQPVRNVQQPTLQQTAAVGAQTQTTRDVQANAVTANANGDNAATPTQTITMPAANRNQNGTITTTNQQQQTEGVLLQTTTQQTQTLRNAPPTVIPLPPTPTPPILQTLVDWSNAMVLAGFTTDGKYLVAHTAGSTNNAGATIALYEYIGGSWSGTNTTQKSDNDDDDDDDETSKSFSVVSRRSREILRRRESKFLARIVSRKIPA